jgi:hypothetical protein
MSTPIGSLKTLVPADRCRRTLMLTHRIRRYDREIFAAVLRLLLLRSPRYTEQVLFRRLLGDNDAGESEMDEG